ncbi:MAG TPA: hypothetical protein VGD60_15405, partial [Candidatus Acidoferrales bacterium]
RSATYTFPMATPLAKPKLAAQCFASAAFVALLTFLTARVSASTPTLDSFYIVTQATFRDGPAWVDHILELRPQGPDVLIREIRIAPLSADCPHHVTVRAIEKIQPSTTVQRLAGKFELCAHAEEDVDGMIHAAKKQEEINAIDDSATQTIVAVCGGFKRMYELPYPETLRFEALELADSKVGKYWEIAADVEADAFGNDFSLARLTPAQDHETQDLAAKLIPELKSGRYKQGFADADCPYAECRDHSITSALQGYSGPIFTCPKE